MDDCTALMAEALHFHVPKGYIYFSMVFSLGVELLNLRVRAKGAIGDYASSAVNRQVPGRSAPPAHGQAEAEPKAAVDESGRAVIEIADKEVMGDERAVGHIQNAGSPLAFVAAANDGVGDVGSIEHAVVDGCQARSIRSKSHYQ